jgi:hypothetical protein
MSLDRLVDAMRDASGDDAQLADATRLRVRRSLETRARGHQQLLSALTVLAILCGGTFAWALATDRVQQVFGPAKMEPPVEVELVLPKPSVAKIAVEPVQQAPEVVPPKPPPVMVVPPVKPVEVLYRKAHALHFHGTDPAAAVAAWDAYLAAEPRGRFAIEARYNRAIDLIKLGRYAEARAALEPYAKGEVDHGYRQAEAEQLVARLAEYQ